MQFQEEILPNQRTTAIWFCHYNQDRWRWRLMEVTALATAASAKWTQSELVAVMELGLGPFTLAVPTLVRSIEGTHSGEAARGGKQTAILTWPGLHVTPDQSNVVDSELPSGQLGMGNKCCL
eukprot:g30309.t1